MLIFGILSTIIGMILFVHARKRIFIRENQMGLSARGCLQFASLPLQGKARRGGSRGCLQFEKSPSPAGRSPQRGRVGVGVGDIAHEINLLFFNAFYALTSTLLRKQCLSHRDWNSSRSERGGIFAVFPVFSSLHKHTEKCDSPRF